MKYFLNFLAIGLAALILSLGLPATAEDAGQDAALRGALKQALIENNALRSELKAAREEIERMRTMMMERPAVPGAPAGSYSMMPAPQKTHTVASGETLGSISSRYYGASGQYKRIYDANRGVLSSPNSISPGQVLVIP